MLSRIAYSLRLSGTRGRPSALLVLEARSQRQQPVVAEQKIKRALNGIVHGQHGGGVTTRVLDRHRV